MNLRICVAGVLFVLAQPFGAQPAIGQRVADWTVKPSAGTGATGPELFRITDGAFVSASRILVASSGNHDLVLIDRNNVVKTLGREGAGPEEFRYPNLVKVFGDTIAAYDASLQRISLWNTQGKFIESIPLPRPREGRSSVEEIQQPRVYVMAQTNKRKTIVSGVETDSAALFRYDAVTNKQTPIADRRWENKVIYIERRGQFQGMTGYSVPFFAHGHVAATSDGIVAYTDGEFPRVELFSKDGTSTSVALPLATRPFDSKTVKAHVDSITRGIDPIYVARIRTAFTDIPTPKNAPLTGELISTPDNLFFIAVNPPSGAKAREWLVLDAKRKAVIAKLTGPEGMEILAANTDQVLGRTTNDDGEEIVTVYNIQKSAVRR